MRSVLNITILISSVLSIFSTSIALFEMPALKETISAMQDGEKVSEQYTDESIKRIYISHDVSNQEDTPVLTAQNRRNNSKNNHIEVFGVKVPIKSMSSKS